jgi:hypothetical protein
VIASRKQVKILPDPFNFAEHPARKALVKNGKAR